jgi:excisionase family DNA binding protein
MLTVADVMKAAQLSEDTVLRHAASGKLRGIKVVGRWRFRHDDVEAYLNGEVPQND